MVFSSKQKSQLKLLIDLQSSVVRGALVRYQPSTPPEFIYIYTVPIPFKPHINSGYLVKMANRAVTETIEAVLRELSLRSSLAGQKKPLEKISEVHYILSSPWIVSQSKTLELSFPKDTKINQNTLRPIIAEERKKLTDNDADRLLVIEEKVFDVRLNGYSTPSWEGRMARDIEVSFVVSVAGTRMIDNLRHCAHHMVSTKHVEFHSSLLLQNIGIRKVLPKRSTYSLIHVHGELTDVLVINKHSCIFFGSFPLGIHGIIRKIAHATKTDTQTAESLLTLYIGGHLDPSHANATAKTIESISHGWISELEKILSRAGLHTFLPEETLISAHSHDNYFSKILKQARPNTSVEILSVEHIVPYVNFARQVDRLRILSLCALAIG